MLDINTLLFASITSRCGFVLIFIIASFKSEVRLAFRFWTGSICASSIGLWLIYSDTHYPYPLAMKGMVIYTTIGFSLACLRAGGHAFFGQSVNWFTFALIGFIPGIVFGGGRVLGVMPDLVMAFTFAALTTLTAASAYLFLKRRARHHLSSQWLVGVALSAYTMTLATSFILLVVRVLIYGFNTNYHEEEITLGVEITLSLFIDQLMSVLIYVGLVSLSLEFVQLRISELAEVDPLTGLVNRRGLHDRGADLIRLCQPKRRPVSVLIMDIDDFKSVNDNYGHDGGDTILKEVARRLSSHCRRDHDLAGRWGGEEFLVLLNGVTLPNAVAFAERFRLYVSETPFEIGNDELTVTVSIGVAEIDLRAPHLERTVKIADEALYEAKRGGRNRVQYIEMSITP